MKFFKVLVVILLFNFASCEDATTDSISQDSSFPSFSTTPQNSRITTTLSPNNISTPKIPSKQVESIEAFRSYQVPLVKERLTLNITAQEIKVEFTLILSKIGNSFGKIGGVSVSNTKRFLLALETDHFNVDVISLSFVNNINGLGFSNKIEDFGWNKKNGIFIPDNVNHYKWITSQKLENDSGIFISFQRNWQTCDSQDIQFGLSPMKIWWFLDTENDFKKLNSKQMAQISEKQKDARTFTTTTPTALNITKVPGKINQTLNSNVQKNESIDTFLSEVEVLKSIQDINFQGPANLSIVDWTFNVTSYLIKSCGDSNVIFQCNLRQVQQLSKVNNSKVSLLFIYRTNLQGTLTKKVSGHKIETCKAVIDYLQDGNSKIFNALFGAPRKNGERSIYQGIPPFFFVLNVIRQHYNNVW